MCSVLVCINSYVCNGSVFYCLSWVRIYSPQVTESSKHRSNNFVVKSVRDSMRASFTKRPRSIVPMYPFFPISVSHFRFFIAVFFTLDTRTLGYYNCHPTIFVVQSTELFGLVYPSYWYSLRCSLKFISELSLFPLRRKLKIGVSFVLYVTSYVCLYYPILYYLKFSLNHLWDEGGTFDD